MLHTDSPSLDTRVPLIGLDRRALEKELVKLGEPEYRAKQIWHWIYQRGVKNFDDMKSKIEVVEVALRREKEVREKSAV